MRKMISAVLVAALTVGVCGISLAACGDNDSSSSSSSSSSKKDVSFEKETIFHVDLSMSTAIGPLGTLCNPGTITFRTDGTATFDVPFTDSALVMMDQILHFRIPEFKHQDTYELSEDKTEIVYHSTRKDFEEPQTLKLETLSDGSWKFMYDIGVQIPDTKLYFYSNPDMMNEYNPEPDEPEPEPETYSASFDAGKGVVFEEGYTLPADTTYDEVTTIEMPEAKFSKEGNAFRGWAANGKIYEYGKNYLYQPGETVTIDAEIEFVAVWTDSFHVTLTKGPDGKSSVGDMVMPDTLYGKYVYLPANPYDYKDYSKGFAGWSDGNGKIVQAGSSYKVTQDVTFEPVWKEYLTVTFKANADDTTSFIMRTPAGTSIILPDASCVGENDTAFAGWLKNGTGSAAKPGTSATITANTLYIASKAAQVTVSFDANGAAGTAPADMVVGNNLYFVFPECTLTKEGCVFNGWGTGATSASGFMPGSRTSTKTDKKYYAVWRTVRTVSFDTGVEGKEIESVSQGEGMRIVLPEMPYENGNKLFDGWSVVEKKGPKIYDAGASYTVPAGSDTAFTAVWRSLVSVEFNGGSGATGTVEGFEKYQSKQFTFPENDFVMSGKLFGGWSDGENTYMPGDTYTIAEDAPAKLTFNAVWNEGTPYADYTVVFRSLMNSVEVYKDADGKSVTLNNFFPGGSMTELSLRPDLTADFRIVSTLSEKDFNTHNTAGNLGLTLAKFQENFVIDKKNISYDYDKATNTVKLNLGGGQTMDIALTKAAKNDTIGFDNIQFEFALKNKIGAVEKLTFAAIDGKPVYLAEQKVFKGAVPADAPSFANTKVTLTVNSDGTGSLKASILTLNFTHQITPDSKKIIWLGDEGAFIEGDIGRTADGKMTMTVTLLGLSITLTEE